MAAQVVSLTSQPNQALTVQLVVDGAALTLNLYIAWSPMAGVWLMDVADATGALLLTCIALVTGVWPAANLLAQYGYLKIGSAYILNTSNDVAAFGPSADNLGSTFLLVWGDTAA